MDATCPICGPCDCGCTAREKDQYEEIQRLRLTDAERYAVTAGLRSLERALWADPENLGGEYRDIQRDAATLRGLLKRCSQFAKRESDRPQPIAKRESDRSQPIECTPEPHATPAEGTVPTDCTDTGET